MPEEAWAVQGLPVFAVDSAVLGIKQWRVDDLPGEPLSITQKIKMSGNGMHVPTVALLLLVLATHSTTT